MLAEFGGAGNRNTENGSGGVLVVRDEGIINTGSDTETTGDTDVIGSTDIGAVGIHTVRILERLGRIQVASVDGALSESLGSQQHQGRCKKGGKDFLHILKN